MPLSWNEIKHRAIAFSKEWKGETRESAERQSFWNDFFQVFGVKRRTVATFEEPVKKLTGDWGSIDLFWPRTLLAEHKSAGKDLGKAHAQGMEYIRGLQDSGRGKEAPRYLIVSDFQRIAIHDLEPEQDPDAPLFHRLPPTVEFSLADFHRHIRHFFFIAGYKQHKLNPEDPANEEATRLMCDLHDALEEGEYGTDEQGRAGHELKQFLVRLLFCLFAEDNGIFATKSFQFYLTDHTAEDGSDLGGKLHGLFEVLNTPEPRRQKNLDADLADFPYINGQLFAERLALPAFTSAMRVKLLACCAFDWSTISPAVFGSLFQSVMDSKERRQIGAHYTAERNILKVVRSLFLDDLRAEFDAAKKDKSGRGRGRLVDLQKKLAGLRFLDPACGCGNFLVITYRELRALEIEILAALHGDQQEMTLDDVNKLSLLDVDQMFGIEIEEFPARIAETALWLTDHQANVALGLLFTQAYLRIPLRKSPHIHVANALRKDWREVLPPAQCSYVLGNPPFVGKHLMSAEQQADMDAVWGGVKGAGFLDFVTAWYRKAAEYITGSADGWNARSAARFDETPPQLPGTVPPSPEGSRNVAGGEASSASENHRIADTHASAPEGAAESADVPAALRGASDLVAGSGGSAALHHRLHSIGPAGPQTAVQTAAPSPRVAFVSTNSICQGEQVGILWTDLFNRFRVKIHFAHRTFAWASEARGKAHVHVVIIGFGLGDGPAKRLYDYDHDPENPTISVAANISPYLIEGSDLALPIRRDAMCAVPEIINGNKPTDGGFLIMAESERAAFLAENIGIEPYLRPYVSAEEFINGSPRWVLWLKDAPPEVIRRCPGVLKRLEGVRDFRSKSTKIPTKAKAATPALFDQVRQPTTSYLVIPKTSSERRRYIPIAVVGPEVIASTELQMIPEFQAFHFGILTSAMHMSWVRHVCGRLKSDFRYSNKIVYNNYPWPEAPTPAQRAAVEKAAQAVLDARVAFPGSTLADLYDPLAMPPALAAAHTALDRATDRCYRAAEFPSDRARVEYLFALYEKLTAPLAAAAKPKRGRKTKPAQD